MLKNFARMTTAALIVSTSMCVPVFAAETKEEFRAEAETYYTQIKELNAQIDTLRESSKQSSDRFKEIGKSHREENAALPVDDETWNQIKELRKSISDYHSEKEASTVKEMRNSAKAAADSGDYDGAIEIIKGVVSSKQERLEKAKAANDIWQQIDALLD